MTKTKIVLGAVALLVVGFVLGVLGSHQQPVQEPLGAGGPTVYADQHFVGDVYNGINDTKMLSGGYVYGPLRVGTTTAASAIDGIFTGTASWNPALLGSGNSATTSIVVAGATAGDECLAGIDGATARGGYVLSCQVPAASTAVVTLYNATGSLDIVTSTIRATTFSH